MPVGRLTQLPAEIQLPIDYTNARDGAAVWGTSRQLWFASGSILLRDLTAALVAQSPSLGGRPFAWDSALFGGMIDACSAASVEAPSSFPRERVTIEWLSCGIWLAYRHQISALGWQDVRVPGEVLGPNVGAVLPAAVGDARFIEESGDRVPVKNPDHTTFGTWGDFFGVVAHTEEEHGNGGGGGGSGGGGGARSGGSSGGGSGLLVAVAVAAVVLAGSGR